MIFRIKEFNNISYFFLILISLLFTFFLRNQLDNNFALGNHTIILFIPFVLYSFYLFFIERLDFKFFRFVIFILFSFIPIYFYLNNYIIYHPADDPYKYSIFAHYMIDNYTLQGNPKGTIFHYQPGFRYFFALELLIFGNENRLMQITNIFLYLSIFFLFFSIVMKKFNEEKNIILLVLIFLSIPFVIKNILFSLSDWFAVFLFLLSSLMFLSRRYLLFTIILALIPFIRQNLIIVTIFIFIIHLFECKIVDKKFKFLQIFIFFIILLLPVFHNIYYVNSYSFFTTNTGIKFLNIDDSSQSVLQFFNFSWIFSNYKQIIDHFIFYKLSEIFLIRTYGDSDHSLQQIFTSLFVPLMIFYLIYLLYKIKIFFKKIIFLFVIVFSFGPTMILGTLYFPRFEYVSIFLSLIYYFSFLKKET